MIRRIAAAAAILTTLATNPAFAASPEVEQIIGLDWSGVSTMPADFTQSGKVVLTQTLKMRVDASDDLHGTATTEMVLDGTTYRATFDVTGHYDGKAGMRAETTLSRGDWLPNGLRWCGGTSHLTIYRDQDRAGHYLLQGTDDDVCGGHSQLEYQDR